MAGASTSANGSLPKRSDSATQLATAPGTVAESKPRLGGVAASPYLREKYSGVHAAGAGPDELRPCNCLPSHRIANESLPSPLLHGSQMVMQAAAAMAASTALPPFHSMRSPACAASGCHGTPDAARSAFQTANLRIQSLNTTLKAQLKQVPATEFSNTDNRYSTAEGAQFNSKLADMEGSVVHNPFLLEALLTGSIAQITKDYGIKSAPGVVLQNIMRTYPH